MQRRNTANVEKANSFFKPSCVTRNEVIQPSAVKSFSAVVPLTAATNCMGLASFARCIQRNPRTETKINDPVVAGHHHDSAKP